MTKWQSRTAALTLGAIAIGTVTAFNQPSYAQGTTFYCGVSDGIPTTFANTKRGTVRVVVWNSEHFSYSGYTPERRCQEVSSRFQRLYNSGQLRFVTAGYLNGQPAICAGNSSPPCTSDKLLFTLKPGSDAAERIQRIFEIGSSNASNPRPPLYESPDGSSSPATIDMNRFLEQASVVQTAGSAPNPALNTQPAVEPNNGGGGDLFN